MMGLHDTLRTLFAKRLKDWLCYSGGIACLALIYVLFAKLGLSLATLNHNASPVWPATGFAMAALALLGQRYALGIFLGAFLSNLLVPSPWGISLSIGVGNTLEAVLGAYILTRNWDFLTIIYHEQRKTVVYISAALIGVLPSAVIGTVSLYFGGLISGSDALPSMLTWYVGDLLGALVVCPFLLSLGRAFKKNELVGDGAFRDLVLFSATLGFSIFLFFLNKSPASLVLSYFFLLGVAFYYPGIRIKAATLLISVVGVAATVLGYGPFWGEGLNDNLVALQLFLGTTALTSLILAGLHRSCAFFSAAVTLSVAWIFLGLISFSFENRVNQERQTEFATKVKDVEKQIRFEFSRYEEILRGGVGLYSASKSVDRHEWREYANTVLAEKRHKGFLGVGVILPLPRRDTQKFLHAVRSDDSPGFRIREVPGGEVYLNSISKEMDRYVITYIEPEERNQAALGLDIGSERNRRESADRARYAERPTLAHKILLVQDKEKKSGTLMYYPMFKRAEGRKEFYGWVYSPIIFDYIFRDALRIVNGYLDLHVSEENKDLLYSTNESLRPTLSTKMEIYGVTFHLAWARAKGAGGSRQFWISWTSAAGSILALLLATVVSGMRIAHSRTEELVQSKTEELVRSEANVKKLNEKLQERVFDQRHKLDELGRESADFKRAINRLSIVGITDGKGKIIEVNDKFCEISGYERGELIGRDHRLLSSGYHSKEFIRNLWETIRSGKIWEGEIKNQAKDGSFYWVNTVIFPVLAEDGSIKRYISIRNLITERKRREASIEEATSMEVIDFSKGERPVDLPQQEAIAAGELKETVSAFKTTMLDPRVVAGLREIDDGKNSFFEEVGQTFLAGAPKSLEKMYVALASGDWRTIEEVAHKLKSSAGNFGAVSIQHIAGWLEGNKDWSDRAMVQKKLDEIKSDLELVKEAFAQENAAFKKKAA